MMVEAGPRRTTLDAPPKGAAGDGLAAGQAIRLPDGRGLVWEEHGDPRGLPVLHHHGAVSSRAEARVMAGAAAKLGVRLIAPDRPGIGESDRAPDRPVHDWAADARALLDQLGLERVALLAWGKGAPFALAAAAALGERVTRVGLLGALAPLDRPGAIAALGLAGDRVLFHLASAAPRLADLALCSSSRAPVAARRAVMRLDLSPCDREVLDALPDAALEGAFRHALARGCVGARMEYAALGRAWGFDLARVTQPVTLWHGEEDRVIPPENARHLTSLLPHARLVPLPGRGHMLLHGADLEVALADVISA